jgi:hypothetical protein
MIRAHYVSLCVGALMCAGTMCAMPAMTPAQAATPLDCFDNLMRGRSEIIECTMPLVPSAAEQDELEKQTMGYVKNAECTVSIRIARAEIMAAVQEPDYVFQSPPQPVQCIVQAQWDKRVQTVPISATFAPKIVIRGGKAKDAVPGLGNVTGVPRALSWPVEAAVNSGVGFKSNMLLVINTWLDHMRSAPPRRQALR